MDFGEVRRRRANGSAVVGFSYLSGVALVGGARLVYCEKIRVFKAGSCSLSAAFAGGRRGGIFA